MPPGADTLAAQLLAAAAAQVGATGFFLATRVQADGPPARTVAEAMLRSPMQEPLVALEVDREALAEIRAHRAWHRARIDAEPDARLVFSCGWHITRDGKDVYPWKLKLFVKLFGVLGRLFRVVELDDQVEAARRIFNSDTLLTVVRGSDLEEGPSQGLPLWSRHVGDPVLASNLTRRIDFALFMVEALGNDALIHEAPAIVGCMSESALAYAADD